MNLETATKEVMKILKQVMEEKLTSANVEVSALDMYIRTLVSIECKTR